MNKVLIFLSLLFLSISAIGQKQSISILAGLNINYFLADISSPTRLKLTPAIGANYDIEIRKNVLLGTGLYYIPRGVRFINMYTDENGSLIEEGFTDYNYNYMSFPIRVGIVKGRKIKFIPYASIVPSVLTSATIKSSNPVGAPFQQTIKEPFSDFDLGLMIGMDITFPISDGFALFPAISFYQGLTYFNDTFDAIGLLHWGAFVGIGFKYDFDNSQL